MEKSMVTISIWLKPCVHITSWHWFVIVVELICWACPDCPLLMLPDACVNSHAVAYTATLRQTYSLHTLHESCLMLNRQELANYVWAGSCCVFLHHMFSTSPSCLVFDVLCCVAAWKKTQESRLTTDRQPSVSLTPVMPPGGVLLWSYCIILHLVKYKWLCI